MKRKNIKIILLQVFFIFMTYVTFSSTKSEFISVGNMKVAKSEDIEIEREELFITLEKKGDIKVTTQYYLKNTSGYNLKPTYLFHVDQNLGDEAGKFIKDIKFYQNDKYVKNLRIGINFVKENKNIYREWFAISSEFKKNKENIILIQYRLSDVLNNKDEFVYTFDLVQNFYQKNKAKILYIRVENRTDKLIKSIKYKDHEFMLNKKNEYELFIGNVTLEDNLIIEFEN